VEVAGTADVAEHVARSIEGVGLRVVGTTEPRSCPWPARVHVPPPHLPVDGLEAELAKLEPQETPTIALVAGRHITHDDLLRLQEQSSSFVARWPQSKDAVLEILMELVRIDA
jgi:hypothetical protein